MSHEQTEWPDAVTAIRPEEFPDALRSVIYEINAGLASPKWSLDWSKPERQADLMAAAAIRHCEVLTSEMLLACERGAQYTVKLLGRSLLETWLTGLYVHHGGPEARSAVIGNFEATVRSTQTAATKFDEQLAARIKDAEAKNRKIDRCNVGRARGGKPPLPHVSVPNDVPLNLDLSSAIAEFEILDPRKLPVYDIVDRIRKLTAAAGLEQSFESAYHYGYRTLSFSGAHPTSNVLESYIDGWTYKTVGHDSRLRDLNEAVQATTLLLLAHMVDVIFAKRGVGHPYSKLIVKRFEAAQSQAPHSTRSEVLGAP